MAWGCAVNADDLHRWESTLEGPKRLRAVVLHSKYDHALRVEAAMSLIRMKPRKGQRLGIKLLVEETLPELKSEDRQRILADLIPRIGAELQQPLPPPQANQPQPPDPSFKYKDAAYMMLTYERTALISDPELKKSLLKTLTSWAMADFERRLNDRSQDYGMEQLLRYIGSEAVVGIPKLMTKDISNHTLSKMAAIVAKLGDQKTKEEAAQQLVTIARYVSTKQWRDDKREHVKEANAKAQFDPTPKQFENQLKAYQDEEMLRIFASMKKVGGQAVTDYCLSVASQDEEETKRRQTALAALEGRISRHDPKQIERLLNIVKSSKTPDLVMDQAFRRIRELPRDKVAEPLYELFKTDSWKVRRAAAGTLLQMSTTKHIEEFLTKLGELAQKNLALPELITYGALLGDLKEGEPWKILEPYLKKGPLAARLSAISYFFTYGTKKDLAAIEPLGESRERIPKCEEGGDCEWECHVEKDGQKDKKTIETVGDLVSFCIVPRMLINKPRSKQSGKRDDQRNPEGEEEGG